MRTAYLTVAFLVASSGLLGAQLPVQPTSYIVRFYLAQGDSAPAASTQLPAGAYACGIAPTAPLPTARYVASWDDPADPRTWDDNPATVPNECRYPDPGTGGFVTSPPNLTVWVSIAGGILREGVIAYGDESNRISFTNWVLPNATPGFRVRPGGSVTLAGIINSIVPNWATPNQPTWRLANFTSVLGPFQMMVGTTDGTIRVPEFGAVTPGTLYELTLIPAPQP